MRPVFGIRERFELDKGFEVFALSSATKHTVVSPAASHTPMSTGNGKRESLRLGEEDVDAHIKSIKFIEIGFRNILAMAS